MLVALERRKAIQDAYGDLGITRGDAGKREDLYRDGTSGLAWKDDYDRSNEKRRLEQLSGSLFLSQMNNRVIAITSRGSTCFHACDVY